MPQNVFFHMTVTALFPISPPTSDINRDFLILMMVLQIFLGDLSCPVNISALHQNFASLWTFDRLSMHI